MQIPTPHFLAFFRNRAGRLQSRQHTVPSPPNLLGGHSKVIGENEFSRHKMFVTQTKLGHLDGIPPQARLHRWRHKSHRYPAIKKMSAVGLRTLWLWTFLFSFLLRKYDIWKEEGPEIRSCNHSCNIFGHTIKQGLSARGRRKRRVDKLFCATSRLRGC